MRHGVSEVEYKRAADLGSTARRAGKGEESNPHRHDFSDRGLLLCDAWESAWKAENDSRARK